MMPLSWKYANAEKTVVNRIWPPNEAGDCRIDSSLVSAREVLEWLAEGNEIEPYTEL
jgi:hypothetical protein